MNSIPQKENRNFFFKTAILAIIVIVMSASAYSQEVAPDSSSKEIAVQYLGAVEDMLMISVRYNSLASSKFILSIYNEEGEVVFRNAYSSSNFNRKFKVPKEHGKLNFVFSGVHDKLSRSYTIHSTSKTIEDVVVTKMK